MKKELDMDYQLKLKAVNDEAMQKLTTYREEHQMATQHMQESYMGRNSRGSMGSRGAGSRGAGSRGSRGDARSESR